MGSRDLDLRHFFNGGWATDFAINADVPPDKLGRVNIPYLLQAKNTIYELDGSPHKMPGTLRLNSSALDGPVRGLTDFFIQGTSGTPAQHRVLHHDTKIAKDDADGTFTNIFTGLDSGSIPNYCTFDDFLIICSDKEVPKSWDGTTAQNLAGTPPNFSFCEVHKNRAWGAGDNSNPSTLSFSVLLDPEDWIGAGSGTILIDPDDGDRIMAIASFKDDLWVFKGPNKGSIHRITGSAPTGDDGFARRPFVKGVGAGGPNLLFEFRGDLGFVDFTGVVRSLAATQKFADYVGASITFPINRDFIGRRVNFSVLNKGWAIADATQGVILITWAIDSATVPNHITMIDYRFDPPRLAEWDSFSASALANVVDSASNNTQTIFSGDSAGFVNILFQSNRRVENGTAIDWTIETPAFSYGTARGAKTLAAVGLGIEPKNDGNITFGFTRDNFPEKTVSIGQGGGDTLAPSSSQFTLGTSVLGGASYREAYQDTISGGEFRIIKYRINQPTLDQDAQIKNIAVVIDADGKILEDLI